MHFVIIMPYFYLIHRVGIIMEISLILFFFLVYYFCKYVFMKI